MVGGGVVGLGLGGWQRGFLARVRLLGLDLLGFMGWFAGGLGSPVNRVQEPINRTVEPNLEPKFLVPIL